ncbi:MATE family efflux transporter [Clostridiaceae bacterium HSG29]|nr:MATE family efflux transporter [Clostridiaceae bacterium HSG29]
MVQGFQPIASFNYGAKNFKRVIETVKISTKYLIVYSTIGFLIIQIFPNSIIRIFNNDADLITLGSKAIRFVTILIPLIGVQIIAASLFQALGKAKPALVISMSRQTLFLIPLVLIMPKINNLGLIGIFAAFPIADFMAIILSFILLKKEINLLHKTEEQLIIENYNEKSLN